MIYLGPSDSAAVVKHTSSSLSMTAAGMRAAAATAAAAAAAEAEPQRVQASVRGEACWSPGDKGYEDEDRALL
jgi:hypothetical protein